MSRLSPVNQARWARFRHNRRGYWSLWIFLLLFGLSLCSEPRQPGGCKLKTAPVRPVVAARPAEYVCSEDLFY